MLKRFELQNEEATIYLAQCFANVLVDPPIITLSGKIGAGKTTFIRALLRALGVTSRIKSPTFSVVESYAQEEGAPFDIHHFDLYRIHDEEELDLIGFRDYFARSAMICIEWPEHAKRTLEKVDMGFNMKIKKSGREIEAQAFSALGKRMLSHLVMR